MGALIVAWLLVLAALVSVATWLFAVRRAQAKEWRTLNAISESQRQRANVLDEREGALKRWAKALEPQESLERYAARLRDANEVHRYREKILRRVAEVAWRRCMPSQEGATPQEMVDALKAYAPLRDDGPDPMAYAKVNNLNGPVAEGDDAT